MARKRPPLLDIFKDDNNPLSRHVMKKGEILPPDPSPSSEPTSARKSGEPRYMQIRLTDEDLKLMRIMSAEIDESLQQIGIQALNEYRKSKGYPAPLKGFESPKATKK
jgi:hypothetical protein